MKAQLGMFAVLLTSLSIVFAMSSAPSTALGDSTGLVSISLDEDHRDDKGDHDKEKGGDRKSPKENITKNEDDPAIEEKDDNQLENMTEDNDESANKADENTSTSQLMQAINESKSQIQVQEPDESNSSVNQTQINSSMNQTQNEETEQNFTEEKAVSSGSSSKKNSGPAGAPESRNSVGESPVVDSLPKKIAVGVSESIDVTAENDMINTQSDRISLMSSVQDMSSFVHSTTGLLAASLVAAVGLGGLVYHRVKKREEFWRDLNF